MAITIKQDGLVVEEQLPPFVRGGDVLDAHATVSRLVSRGLSRINRINRNGRLYASDAGLCARHAALAAAREEDEVQNAASVAYCTLGDTIEEIVMDALYRTGALLFKQYKLPDTPINLGGYIDGIIYLAGKLRVLEVKSCGELPNKPKPLHQAQAYLYSAIVGLPATVLYFSRKVATFSGELLLREFELPEDDQFRRAALYQATYGHLAFTRGILPDKPMHMVNKSVCGLCPFINVCWGTDKAGSLLPVEPGTHVELVRETNALVDDLLDPVAVRDRRTGILRHISRAGNKHAKNILNGSDWSKLV